VLELGRIRKMLRSRNESKERRKGSRDRDEGGRREEGGGRRKGLLGVTRPMAGDCSDLWSQHIGRLRTTKFICQ